MRNDEMKKASLWPGQFSDGFRDFAEFVYTEGNAVEEGTTKDGHFIKLTRQDDAGDECVILEIRGFTGSRVAPIASITSATDLVVDEWVLEALYSSP